MFKARALVLAALLALGACEKQDNFNTLPPGEMLKPLSLQAHSNPTWAASANLYEQAQNPSRWSPYVGVERWGAPEHCQR